MTKDEYVHSDIVDELSAGGQQTEINEKSSFVVVTEVRGTSDTVTARHRSVNITGPLFTLFECTRPHTLPSASPLSVGSI